MIGQERDNCLAIDHLCCFKVVVKMSYIYSYSLVVFVHISGELNTEPFNYIIYNTVNPREQVQSEQ